MTRPLHLVLAGSLLGYLIALLAVLELRRLFASFMDPWDIR